MIELKETQWNYFVDRFCNNMNNGYNIQESLKMFIQDYWNEMDYLANQALKEDEEESLDVYFERKMKPMWDYVYNLQKQVNNLQSKVGDLELHKNQTYGPVKYPNNIPPTHDYPLDWYKVTAHCGDMGGNLSPSCSNNAIATSGYMQVVDEPKYTQEEIDEWNSIRWTPKEGH